MSKIIFNAKSVVTFINTAYSIPLSIGIREDEPLQICCSGNASNGTSLVMVGFVMIVSGTRENPTSAYVDQNRQVTINADGTVATAKYEKSEFYIEYVNDTEITL